MTHVSPISDDGDDTIEHLADDVGMTEQEFVRETGADDRTTEPGESAAGLAPPG